LQTISNAIEERAKSWYRIKHEKILNPLDKLTTEVKVNFL